MHLFFLTMATNSETVITIGEDLLAQYPDVFGDSFRRNREEIERLTTVRSKYLCNRLAGYVTRNCE